MEKKPVSIWRSLRLGLMIIIGVVIYAYGVEVTKVDLTEFRKESRQVSRVRTTRALAHPDIIEFEKEEFNVSSPIYVPCQLEAGQPSGLSQTGPTMVITPACGAPGEKVQVEGFNFEPNTEGPIKFVPSTDPNYKLGLQQATVKTDAKGHFIVSFELPERPADTVQYLRVTTRRNVGMPYFSQAAKDTLDKIIETVFLALLATTIGTVAAIPISFFAARNLMKDISSPLACIALSVLGWMLGIWFGIKIANFVFPVVSSLSTNLGLTFGWAIGTTLSGYLLLRWGILTGDLELSTTRERGLRQLAQIIAGFLFIPAIYLISNLGIPIGNAMEKLLGSMGFLGNLIAQLSDVMIVFMPGILALVLGGVLGSNLGKLGQRLNEKLSEATMKVINIFLAALTGGLIFLIFGMVVDWLYEIGNLVFTHVIPMAVGGVLGILLAVKNPVKEPLPIGLVTYTITRTLLNGIRSIEALIMAIVAVIWVGIGPFAGVLALGLHTVVSLAKLYSEQVESIMSGPIEAIKATGATRLQTIVYAVIPQIIPPYISFTIYRWDINVRMSTIIGFAGGGGIGFLLQQNINLLNYRAASTIMLAIAVVVSAMDYLSSYMREKYV